MRRTSRRGDAPGKAAGSVAAIGAGIAGLAAARALIERGLAVAVFDKGRGPGGELEYECGRRPECDRRRLERARGSSGPDQSGLTAECIEDAKEYDPRYVKADHFSHTAAPSPSKTSA